MTEIVCLYCNAQSPESALYCQHCGQPLRCKDCGTQLLLKARVCIHCGKRIPERSANEQFHEMNTVPPGYNRLKLHETPDVREVDLTMSDQAIAHIGDLLPTLIGNRPKGRHDSSVDHQTQKQSDLVEVTSEIPAHPLQPQLPAAPLPPVVIKDFSKDIIWEIFRKQDGGLLKQDIQKLKATSKKDYTVRLVYLYLYAKLQLGEDTVSRTEIYTILDSVGLKDGNTANYINQATGISSDSNETLRLNYDGRSQVQQYITDAFNSELTDGWYPGLDTRSATSRIKKPSKKHTEQYNNDAADADITKWTSHEETKALVSVIPHNTIVNLSVFEQALLALYGIYKAGTEKEVSIASIVKYLYEAFQVQLKSSTISKTFFRIREDKTSKMSSFVNFREKHGYRITPSGRQHIEDLLVVKQPHLTTVDVNVGTNGVE